MNLLTPILLAGNLVALLVILGLMLRSPRLRQSLVRSPARWPDPALAFSLGNRLLVIDADGRHETEVYRGAELRGLSWAPDGLVIAFADRGLYRVDLEVGQLQIRTDQPRQLVERHEGSISAPAWSPNGSEIAFCRSGSLWTVPATGGAARLLHRPEAGCRCEAATWSPNALRIAVVERNTAGKCALRVLEVVLSGGSAIKKTLIEFGAFLDIRHPAWAKTQPLIAFSGTLHQAGTHIVDADTGEVKARLTAGTAWSPDDRLMADRGRRDDSTIAIIEVATHRVRSIGEHTDSDVGCIDWRR